MSGLEDREEEPSVGLAHTNDHWPHHSGQSLVDRAAFESSEHRNRGDCIDRGDLSMVEGSRRDTGLADADVVTHDEDVSVGSVVLGLAVAGAPRQLKIEVLPV